MLALRPLSRSPIRRPPADLDISRVLRSVESLPPFLSSQSLFGNLLPLEIEVGSGKGLFLSNAAANNPRHNFLGIEINHKCAEHAAGRIAKTEATNGLLISGNAEPLFEERVEAGSLEAVHVYFPDPWWKKKQRKRRVLNERSIVNFSKAIRIGGRLHVWTDVLDYFDETVELIAALAPEMGVPIPEEETEAQHDLDYRTHFERRSRRHHIPVYRVRYEKRSS